MNATSNESKKIGLLAKQVLLDAQSKCERCKCYPSYQGRKWCRRCQQWWHRRTDKDATTRYLREMLGLRYFQAKLYHLHSNLLREFQRLADGQSIMLWGDVGCGKTYAMSALARRFYIQGWDVIFIQWYELTLQIREAYTNERSELKIIKPYWRIDKLFIDDIGVSVSKDEQESNFSLRTLDLILDKRLANLRPTFLTSNRSIEDLANTFDARIASRIQEDSIILQTKGRDRRIIK